MSTFQMASGPPRTFLEDIKPKIWHNVLNNFLREPDQVFCKNFVRMLKKSTFKLYLGSKTFPKLVPLGEIN